MTDTAILGRNVEVVQASLTKANSPFSWSAAIAGAISATAVTFIVISLGSGIGLSLASPYRSAPSLTTLTVAGAVWLVMAQAFGFACGGYMAARLRAHFGDSGGEETRFRDGAQGFLVWAIGVLMTLAVAAAVGAFTFGAAGSSASGTAAQAGSTTDTTGYFVDMLFRPPASAAAAGTPVPPAPIPGASLAAPGQPLSAEARAEVARILARSLPQGQLSEQDRGYLARLVSARTGLPPDEAQRRVGEVETDAREAAKQAADAAAKAGAYASFWTFMSLLIGAFAAVLGGIIGGELRDHELRALAGS